MNWRDVALVTFACVTILVFLSVIAFMGGLFGGG